MVNSRVPLSDEDARLEIEAAWEDTEAEFYSWAAKEVSRDPEVFI